MVKYADISLSLIGSLINLETGNVINALGQSAARLAHWVANFSKWRG
jgi:hypothetical protein